MTVLHATEPATVYLSCWARVDALEVADVERALFEGARHQQRSLAHSRPRWTLMRHWLGEVPSPQVASDGYRELVRRWLHTFGPGTEDDIVWWLGATKTVVRAALAELDAEAVSLEQGVTPWLLPDDSDEVPEPGSWVALLPVLDPTVMGRRGFPLYGLSNRSP